MSALQLNEKAEALCSNCLNRQPRSIAGRGNADAEVIFLGGTPGDVDIRRNRPFSGPSSRALYKAVDLAGIDKEQLWYTYAYSCQLPEGKPGIKDISMCSGRLYNELLSLPERKVIVALGAIAMKALFPKMTAISKERGRTVWHEDLNCNVIITHDPGRIWKEPKYFQDLVNDMLKINKVIGRDIQANQYNNIELVLLDCQDDVDELCEVLEELKAKDKKVAIDVENGSHDELLCIGFSWVPLKSAVLTREVMCQETYDKLSKALKGLKITGHFFKSDIKKMWENGFDRLSIDTYSDTMYQSYLLDERRYVEEEYRGVHGLKYLAREFLFVDDYNGHIAPYYTHLEDCDPDTVYLYNGKDAAYTLILDDLFEEQLDPAQRDLLHNHMCPVSDVLAGMEYVGVRVSLGALEDLNVAMTAQLEEIRNTLCTLAGRQFNPNSSKQVADTFYNKLDIPVPKAWSTDKEHLKLIVNEHPIIPTMLQYREVKQFHGLYVNGMLKRVDAERRVHTNFNVARTATGRLSSNGPNLQNIKRGAMARNLFEATPGWTMFEADLSQAEVKGLCWLAKDKILHEAIVSGLDLHTRTASLMYGVPFDKVTKAQRTTAKRITFGLIYQMSPEGLVDALRMDGVLITVAEAVELMKMFFSVYAESERWIESIKASVVEKGYVVSPFGRIRRFPLITEKNLGGVLRQAVNFPVQSMANEISLAALLRFGKRVNAGELGETRLLLTVHDSIMGETREDVNAVVWELKKEMEKPVLDGWVPFTADIGVGSSWGKLKKPHEVIYRRLERIA